MSRSSQRASMRKARQARNRGILTAEDWKQNKTACEQYIVFGGPRGRVWRPRLLVEFKMAFR